MWDALEAKYGVFDAGSELYVMEQFYDYRMVDDRSVVEQSHGIKHWQKNSRILVRCYRISLWRVTLLLSCHRVGQTLLLL